MSYLTMMARCMKCGEQTKMNNPVETTIEVRGSQRRMMKGTCSVCGTKMNKFLKKDEQVTP